MQAGMALCPRTDRKMSKEIWDLEEAVAYYQRQGAPSDQNMLVALLKEVQQAQGGAIPVYMLPQIADRLGAKESLLSALIRRIPSLRLGDRHILEICCGPNCSKRAGLAAFVEKTYGTQPKQFALKYGNCMRLCGKGPNIKWDGKLYHQADEALIRRLVEEA